MTALEYITNLDPKTGWGNADDSFQKQSLSCSKEGRGSIAEPYSEAKQAVVVRKTVEKMRMHLMLPMGVR